MFYRLQKAKKNKDLLVANLKKKWILFLQIGKSWKKGFYFLETLKS